MMTIRKNDLQEFGFALGLVILAIWAILQNSAELLATVVFIPNLILFIPQFKRTFIQKDTEGLSFGSMASLGYASIFFCSAGLIIPEMKMFFVNAFCLLLCAAICFVLNKKLTLYYVGILLITIASAYFTYVYFNINANPYLFLGGWIANLGLIQQCWSIHKTKQTHGVSFKTFTLILFVGGVWLAWAIELNLWGTILSNSVGALCSSYICFKKLKNWRIDHP